jgi:hypothetical protein
MTHDHDSLCRLTFSEPEHAASLLRAILPRRLANAIDWSSLRLLPGTFVDDALKARHADLLFTAMMRGQRVLIYIVLEHKSRAGRWTALQVLRYVVRVFDRFLAENPNATSLPPVIPIVVHHGPRGWTAPRTVLDLVGLDALPPEVRRVLAPLQPNLHFLLDDLAPMSESQLKERRATVQTRLTLLMLQFVRGGKKRDPAAFVRRWLEFLRALWDDPAGRCSLIGLFSYLAAQLDSSADKLEVAAALIHEDARIMGKTIADRLREEGFKKGMASGHVDFLLRLVRRRFGPITPATEARIRGADIDTLERWAERLPTASTLDEMFA